LKKDYGKGNLGIRFFERNKIFQKQRQIIKLTFLNIRRIYADGGPATTVSEVVSLECKAL
jgi:hypothetical protein